MTHHSLLLDHRPSLITHRSLLITHYSLSDRYESTFDHFDALLLESFVPLALLALAELMAMFKMMLQKKGAKKAHVLSAWLTLLFLVLPVISRRVFQSFGCSEYDDGAFRYLVCHTSTSTIDP